jgi:uncharacterized Zn-finger protein
MSQAQLSAAAADFLCEICSSKFDSNTKLQTHLLIKHEFQSQANFNGVTFTCPVCDEAFSQAYLLLSHTSVHGQAAKIYKCTKCPQAYVFKSQLINHSFAHQQAATSQNNVNNTRNGHNSGASETPFDSQETTTSPKQRPFNGQNVPLNRASRINQPVSFNSTNRATNNNNNNNSVKINPQYLNRLHEDISQEDTGNSEDQQQPLSHAVGQPGAQYVVNTNAQTNVRTYTCLSCSKTFANQRNLNVHLRIHTGFRPFECDVCKRKFTRRENLRSHMKCHLNVRPFACSICNRSFRRKSHVTSHIEVHLKSRVHNCIECSRQFDALDLFLVHLINDHSIHDRELLSFVKQKQLVDPAKLNINIDQVLSSLAHRTAVSNGRAVGGKLSTGEDGSITIQSLIDQNSKETNEDEDLAGDEEEDYDDYEDDGEYDEGEDEAEADLEGEDDAAEEDSYERELEDDELTNPATAATAGNDEFNPISVDDAEMNGAVGDQQQEQQQQQPPEERPDDEPSPPHSQQQPETTTEELPNIPSLNSGANHQLDPIDIDNYLNAIDENGLVDDNDDDEIDYTD